MRGLRNLIVLASVLMATCFTQSVFAQDTHVMVRVYEPVNQKGEIVISYGNGKSERIAIEKLNSEHHENNANKIVEIFNRLAKEGFNLESSAGSSHGNGGSILHVETYVFVKED